MTSIDQPTRRSLTPDGIERLDNGLRVDEWTRHPGMVTDMANYLVKKNPQMGKHFDDVREDIKVLLWQAQQNYLPDFDSTFANWCWRHLYQRADYIVRLHLGHGFVTKAHQAEVPMNLEAREKIGRERTPLDILEKRDDEEVARLLPACVPSLRRLRREELALAPDLPTQGSYTGVSQAERLLRGRRSGTGLLVFVRKHFDDLEEVCNQVLKQLSSHVVT